ncbi:hypothetical protein HMPREF0044_0275 [Gleimia coleocanis DSM 15436]|uniref:TadE-like protein n=1 Tax=Gleimia coleocanis DSM 15436 TaxID=525245 RepID=C0VYN5_9ACTO|nr:hypothetical protein [Gleimia coleocanis]EEH64538.1 hypothetical protein HMPREF0044_0275 [Gleimia coleocanis DSM 15436]
MNANELNLVRQEQEAGMVTAETALAFPALILVTSFLIGMLIVAGAKGSSCAVAFEAGRAIVVGEAYSSTAGYEVSVDALGNEKVRVTAVKQMMLVPVECQLVLKREAVGNE